MARILPGDPIPLFEAVSSAGPAAIGQFAGRWLVLSFFGSMSEPQSQTMLAFLCSQAGLFDGGHMSLVGVCTDRFDDAMLRGLTRDGVCFLDDRDQRIAGLFGITRRQTLVIDRGLRLFASVAIDEPLVHGQRLLAALHRLPRTPPPVRTSITAPVLAVPMVFEPAFCRTLIEYFETHPNVVTGVMAQNADGLTETVYEDEVKRRRDCPVQDDGLAEGMRSRLVRRLFPELRKAFGFEATRIERYMVSRYDAQEGGYFGLHRDNVLPGTAHRRFGVTINLNADDYDGGDLRFPEHDHRAYRAPTGGAIVFSASLLHEVLPVTRGRRYACLPFLYDEAAAALRVRNAGLHAEASLRSIAESDRDPSS